MNAPVIEQSLLNGVSIAESVSSSDSDFPEDCVATCMNNEGETVHIRDGDELKIFFDTEAVPLFFCNTKFERYDVDNVEWRPLVVDQDIIKRLSFISFQMLKIEEALKGFTLL